MSVVPGLGGAAEVVRSHHERFDGSGYPDGLAGEQIPIGARIVGAADAFVAMTESRPYEGPRGHREAVAELERSAGRQFDPSVVGRSSRCWSTSAAATRRARPEIARCSYPARGMGDVEHSFEPTPRASACASAAPRSPARDARC